LTIDSRVSPTIARSMTSHRALHRHWIGCLIWLAFPQLFAASNTWPDHNILGTNGQVPPVDGPAAGGDLAALRAEVLAAHNRIRAEAKLPPLSVSAKLQAAAEVHAKDMAAQKKMSHTGSDGTTVLERTKARNYRYYRVGENIAHGRYTTARLMKGWMDSPPHKRNILGSFSQIGVACATAEDGKRYWCVTFGLPARR
jgi:uncharacterized protein YkwD